jgi:hypothetical protein
MKYSKPMVVRVLGAWHTSPCFMSGKTRNSKEKGQLINKANFAITKHEIFDYEKKD